MDLRLHRRLALVAALIVPWVDGCAPVAAAPALAADRVSMWFESADLVAVVRRAAAATGRSLLTPETGPMAGKKATLLVADPVTPEKAWELALGALAANGLAASCHGTYVVVIPASEAQGAPGCR